MHHPTDRIAHATVFVTPVVEHHPTDRIEHTTAVVTPVVEHWLEREIFFWHMGGSRWKGEVRGNPLEQEIAQWVENERRLKPTVPLCLVSAWTGGSGRA